MTQRRALFYSFAAYLVVLFGVIVLDTFARKDFDFQRAAFISAVYLGVLLVFFAFFYLVLKGKAALVRVIGSWLLVGAYVGVILYLSSLSDFSLISRLEEMDPRRFSLHVLEYSGLGFLLYLALSHSGFPYRWVFLSTLLIGLTFGFLDELYQSHIPGRRFNPYDIASDGVGVLLGSTVAILRNRRNKK